jgi:hypothetical protein
MTDNIESGVRTEPALMARYGAATAEDNLRAALAAGRLVERPDGKLTLPRAPGRVSRWVFVPNRPYLRCGFLTKVVFEAAYAKTAVPDGCSACYKVKVSARTLRELVAAWEIAKAIDCLSKWGVDLDNPYSQDIYAGYYYAGDLDAARVLHRIVRAAIDADSRLGPGVGMTIKRGCSQFEAAVGPSDSYTFTPQMAALEAHLWSRFEPPAIAAPGFAPLADWIDLAFRLGDDTYLDFTGGHRLRPATLSYEP